MIYKLQNNRVYRSYLGGKNLDRMFGAHSQDIDYFPEDWIASVVTAFNPGRNSANEGLSKTADGRFLRDIISENPQMVLGKEQSERFGGKMSVLVKLLDSAERLVIQVHPTIEFAKQNFNSNFGKTECWYFTGDNKESSIYLGFKEGITYDKWVRCFENQDVEAMLEMMHCIKVEKGDMFFVDGGVPHAIGAGCFMIELQEPTDLMVIPERVTPSGIRLAEEKLHCGLGFEKMFDCFVYEGISEEKLLEKYKVPRRSIAEGVTQLIGRDTTDKFQMLEVLVSKNMSFSLSSRYAIVIILEGSGTINEQAVKHGDRLFIGADTEEISLNGRFQFVICLP